MQTKMNESMTAGRPSRKWWSGSLTGGLTKLIVLFAALAAGSAVQGGVTPCSTPSVVGTYRQGAAPLHSTDGNTPTVSVTPHFNAETLTLTCSEPTYTLFFYTSVESDTNDGPQVSVMEGETDVDDAFLLGEDTYQADNGIISVSGIADGRILKIVAVKVNEGTTITIDQSEVLDYTIERYPTLDLSFNWNEVSNHAITILPPTDYAGDYCSDFVFRYAVNTEPSFTTGEVAVNCVIPVQHYNATYNIRAFKTSNPDKFPSTAQCEAARYNIPFIENYVPHSAPSSTQALEVYGSGTVVGNALAYVYINTSITDQNDELVDPDPSNSSTYNYSFLIDPDNPYPTLPEYFTADKFKMVTGHHSPMITCFTSAVVTVDRNYSEYLDFMYYDGSSHHHMGFNPSTRQIENSPIFDQTCLWKLNADYNIYQTIGDETYYLTYNSLTHAIEVVNSENAYGNLSLIWFFNPENHVLTNFNDVNMTYADGWRVTHEGTAVPVAYTVGKRHSSAGSYDEITSFTLDNIEVNGTQPLWIALADNEACSLSVTPHVTVTTYTLPEHDHYYFTDQGGHEFNFTYYARNNRSYQDHRELPYHVVSGESYTVHDTNITYTWHLTYDNAEGSGLTLGTPTGDNPDDVLSHNRISRNTTITAPQRALVTVEATYSIHNSNSGQTVTTSRQATSAPLVVYAEQKAPALTAYNSDNVDTTFADGHVYMLANYFDKGEAYANRYYLTGDVDNEHPYMSHSVHSERVFTISYNREQNNYMLENRVLGEYLGRIGLSSSAFNTDEDAATYLASNEGDESHRRYVLTPYRDGTHTYFTIRPATVGDSCSLVPQNGDEPGQIEGANLRLMNTRSGVHTYVQTGVAPQQRSFDEGYYHSARWQLIVPTLLPPNIAMDANGIVTVTDNVGYVRHIPGVLKYKRRSSPTAEWGATQEFDTENPPQLQHGEQICAWKEGAIGTDDNGAYDYSYMHRSPDTIFTAHKVNTPTLTHNGNVITFNNPSASENYTVDASVYYTVTLPIEGLEPGTTPADPDPGATPGENPNAILYTDPSDMISHACTLTYRAYAPNCIMSDPATYTHTAVLPLAIHMEEDAANPGTTNVTMGLTNNNISTTEYVIYYTTDGTDPEYDPELTTGNEVYHVGTLYEEGQTLPFNSYTILKAKAFPLNDNYTASPVLRQYINGQFMTFTYVDTVTSGTETTHTFNMMLLDRGHSLYATNAPTVNGRIEIDSTLLWMGPTDVGSTHSLIYNGFTSTYLTFDLPENPSDLPTAYGTDEPNNARVWGWGGEPGHLGQAVSVDNYRLYTDIATTRYFLAFDKATSRWVAATATQASTNSNLKLAVAYRTDTVHYGGGEEFSARGVNLFIEQGTDNWVPLDTTSAWLALSQGQSAHLKATLKGKQIHYEPNIDINIHKAQFNNGDEHDADNYVPWQQWHQKEDVFCQYFYEVAGYEVHDADNVVDALTTISWGTADEFAGALGTYFTITPGEAGTATLTRTNNTPADMLPVLDLGMTVGYSHHSVYANIGVQFSRSVLLNLYAETTVAFDNDSLSLRKRLENLHTNQFLSAHPEQTVGTLAAYPYLSGEPVVGTVPEEDYIRYAVWYVHRHPLTGENDNVYRFTMTNLGLPDHLSYHRPDNQGGIYLVNPNGTSMFNYLHQPTHPANPVEGGNEQYTTFGMKKYANGFGYEGTGSELMYHYYVTISPYGDEETRALNEDNTWQPVNYGNDHAAGGATSYWSRRWKWERGWLTPPVVDMDPSGVVTLSHRLQTATDITDADRAAINDPIDPKLKFYYTKGYGEVADPTVSSTLWDGSTVTLGEGETIKVISCLTQSITGYEPHVSHFHRTFTAVRTATPERSDNGTLTATEGDSLVLGRNVTAANLAWNSHGEDIYQFYQSEVLAAEYAHNFNPGDVLTVKAYRHNQLASLPLTYADHLQLKLQVEAVNPDNGDGTATVTFHVSSTINNGYAPSTNYYTIHYTTATGTSVPAEPTSSSSTLTLVPNSYSQTLTLTVDASVVTRIKAVALPTEGTHFYLASDLVEAYIVPSNYTGNLSGSGTQANPYLIQTPLDMITVSSNSNLWNTDKYFKVTADIDMTGITLQSIGNSNKKFNGHWDGNYKVISHLTKPLFHWCNNAHVYNMVIDNSIITGVPNDQTNNYGRTAAIASTAEGNTRIYNCGVRATEYGSVNGTGSTGAMVGKMLGYSRVVNCYNFATITSSGGHAGGIIGEQESGKYSTAKSNEQRGIVFNCMNYGDVTCGSGKNVGPVLGGQVSTPCKYNSGFNTYNYYKSGIELTGTLSTNYAQPAEGRFLTRFEFFRTILNANLKKCGWWIDGTFAEENPGGATMGKWVLDKSKAPYPIVLPKYSGTDSVSYTGDNNQTIKKPKVLTYPSIINPDYENPSRTDSLPFRGRNLGTLQVTVNSGSPVSAILANTSSFPNLDRTSSEPLTLAITDMDTTAYDYNYYKVQLPYFQDLYGVGSCVQTVDGQDYIVTGWEITSVTDGTNGTFSTTCDDAYNFADRYCTSKDLYSASGRVFAQGGYYNVPEGVRGIAITAHWGRALYLAEGNNEITYNEIAYGDNYTKNNLNFYGSSANNTLYGKRKTVYTSRTAVLNAVINVPTVYDQAIVLLGDYHNFDNYDFRVGDNNTDDPRRYWPFTITSADEDNDHEPDHCLYQSYNQRHGVNPVRYDLIANLDLSLAGLTGHHRSTSIALPNGHFEITETAMAHYWQFEYDERNEYQAKDKIKAPLILNGGAFEQIVSTQASSSLVANKTEYIQLGGHVWFKMFSPGTHGDKAWSTAHCPVTVTGGEYKKFYLSGMFSANAAYISDNPCFYANGGKFGTYASGGQEKIDGNVTVKADHIIANEFYGGGINSVNPITGNISITLNNSMVGLYAGGPMFGDMATGKAVTTNATGTTFGTYYGAGYGGTSLYKTKHIDIKDSKAKPTLSEWDTLNNYQKGIYDTYGIFTDYEFEFMPLSGGGDKNVRRFYTYRASLSKATTYNVSSTLTNCTVLNDYYGAGYVGSVNGKALSVLENCTVNGNVYAGGNSSTAPKAKVYDMMEEMPTYSGGVYTIPERPKETEHEYTWTHVNETISNNTEQIATVNGENLIYTNVTLDDMGQANETELTIKGNTVVKGSVFGGGNLAEVSGNTQVTIGENGGYSDDIANHRPYIHKNVYGGGNAADVGSATASPATHSTVDVYGGYVRSVYGGGNKGSVLGSTQVNLLGGFVGYTPTVTAQGTDYAIPVSIQPTIGRDRMFFGVYGGGFGIGTTVSKTATVNIGSTTGMTDDIRVFGSVYGGGEAGQVGGGYRMAHLKENQTLNSDYYYFDLNAESPHYVRCTNDFTPVEGTDYYTFMTPAFANNTTSITVLADNSATDNKTTEIFGAVYGGGRGYYMALENDTMTDGSEVVFVRPTAGAVYGNTHAEIGTLQQDASRLKIGSLSFYTDFDTATHYGLINSEELLASPIAFGEKHLHVYDMDNKRYIPLTTDQNTANLVNVLTMDGGVKEFNTSLSEMDSEVKYFTPSDRVSVAGGGENGSVFGSTVFDSDHILFGESNRHAANSQGCTEVVIHSGTIGDIVDSAVGGDVYGAGLRASIDGTSKVTIDGSTAWIRGNVYAGGCMGANHAYNRQDDNTPITVTEANVRGGWIRNLHAASNLVVLPKNGNSKMVFGHPGVSDDSLLVSESIYGGSGLASMQGSTEVTVNSGRVGYVREGYAINEANEIGDAEEPAYSMSAAIVANSSEELSYEGNVYGGGYGPKAAVKSTKVTVTGGEIRNGVLGGGELAPVGDVDEEGAGVYEYHTYDNYAQDAVTTTHYNIQEGYVTDIKILGGHMSAVCGGGRGYSNFLTVHSTTPGTIMGNTSIYIGGGTIDAEEYASELGGGNVYGGGLEGEVTGNTRVTIAGGIVDGRVFAGGRGYRNSMLQVLTEEEMAAGESYDDIFDRASRRAGWVMGNTLLTIKDSSTTVNGTATPVTPEVNYGVYGGGEGMSYKTILQTPNGRFEPTDEVATVYGHAEVNITGGRLGLGYEYGKQPGRGSYAGGRVASVRGWADIRVSGNADVAAVFGGNDISGKILCTDGRSTASVWGEGQSNADPLDADSTRTYVRISGTPKVGHVFGGGNGQYNYYNDVVYRHLNLSRPEQTSTYVDLNTSGGWVNQVFGGGNSAKVLEKAQVHYRGTGLVDTIFAGGNSETVNQEKLETGKALVKVYASGPAVAPDNTRGGHAAPSSGRRNEEEATVTNHINYLFGGNNMATMNILPELELVNGVLGNVYGGGNAGAMTGNSTRQDIFDNAVPNLSTYVFVNSEDVTITGSLFGGCNNAPVSHYTYVDVRKTSEKGIHMLFGGNDISESVRQARLDINGGTIERMFGGGNGYYTYTRSGNNWDVTDKSTSTLVATGTDGPPVVDITYVNVWGGDIRSSIYGGGYAGNCRITNVVVNDTIHWSTQPLDRPETGLGRISGKIFGGGFGDIDLIGTDKPHVGNVTLKANSNLYHISHLGKAYAYGGGEAGDVENAEITVHPNWNKPLTELFGGCYGSDAKSVTVNMYCKDTNNVINVETLFGGNDSTGTVEQSVVNVYDGRYNRVFGAGNGVGSESRPNSKQPTVNFYKGTVVDNLYGGGDQGMCYVADTTAIHTNADDYAHVVLNIHGGEFLKDVFTGASGDETERKQLIYGLKQLNMDGGTVHNSVYGGSESVKDGYKSTECTDSTSTSMRPSSILNITGGEVRNNVYGGGYLGDVYGSVYVNIGKDAVDKSPVWTNAYPATGTANTYADYKPGFVDNSSAAVDDNLMMRDLSLEASVYNGANWGEAGTRVFFDTRGFYGGESRIYVDGKGYNTSGSSSGSSLPSMNILYSLIGAGTSSEGGDVLRHILVRNYGDYNDCQVSKELFSIQRADTVRLENTAIKFIGDQDAMSAYPSTKYAVNRVKYLRLQGYNVMEIDVPITRTEHLQFLTPNSQILTSSSTEALATMRSGVADVNCTTDVCTKLSAAADPTTKPYSVILVNNGVAIDIVDENGVNGPVEGYGFLLSENGYRAIVTARPKTSGTSPVNANDGGFFSCCDENSYTDNGAYNGGENIGEFEFVNNITTGTEARPSYRTWKAAADSTDRCLRKVTIVAHSDASRLDNNKQFVASVGEGDDVHDEYFGLAKGTIELPSTAPGHYYTIDNGVSTGQNSEMLLQTAAFKPNSFNPSSSEQIVTGGTWLRLPGSTPTAQQVRTAIYNDASRKFGLLMTSGENFANDETNATTTTVIAADAYFAGSGSYRTAAVSTSDAEVIPKLDFYLAYCPNFATTTFGEVTFTLNEYDENNHLVGKIDINVTLSTIIEEFLDQKYDVVAMHNDFGHHEYTRKMVLPASMQRRHLYLTSIQWEPSTGNEQITVGGRKYNTTGIQDGTTKFYLTDTTGTRNESTFALKLEPTENISQSLTTTLGWHSIDKTSLDVYGDTKRNTTWTDANRAYSGTNASTPIPIGGANLSELAALNQTTSPEYTGERGMLMGVLDGRSSAAVDINLLFDETAEYQIPDGIRGEVVLGFDYWNGNVRQGHFDVTVYVRTRSRGDTIYLASAPTLSRTIVTNEGDVTYTCNACPDLEDPDRGKRPSKYIQSFSSAFLDGIYQAGDVLCILDSLVIRNNQSLHGLDYNYIQVVRYEGHHIDYPTRDCAYRGPMITLKDGGTLTTDNMIFDGSMISRYLDIHGTPGTSDDSWDTNTLTAYGPIFKVADGGTLNLGNNTIIRNNYNEYVPTEPEPSEEPSEPEEPEEPSEPEEPVEPETPTEPLELLGGAINVTGANALVKLENTVTIENNLTNSSANTGAIHVDGGTVLLATSKAKTAVTIMDNYKIASGTNFMDNTDHTLDLPNNLPVANVYLTRTAHPDVPNNVLADGQSDVVRFENVASGTRVGITKEFPGITRRDTIGIAKVRGSQSLYAQRAAGYHTFVNDAITNATGDGTVFYNKTISPNTIYFQRCATFQKQLYGEGELAGNNPLEYFVLQESVQNGNQLPVLSYKWNDYSACPDETDSLIYRVHGGFYPYVYTWSWGTDSEHLSIFRRNTTPYSNDEIYNDLADAESSTRFNKATESNNDVAELHGMLLNSNGSGGTFYYSVTATDLAGCPQTKKVAVTMSRGQENANIYLPNGLNIETTDENLKHSWGNINENNTETAQRTYKGIHLVAKALPEQDPVWGNINSNLVGNTALLTLTSDGDLLCPGDAVELNATATTGHSFIQWDFDPYDRNNTVFVMPHSVNDVHINAYFGPSNEPSNYWKNVVNEEPGLTDIRFEYSGDVHIYTEEGLAWLISLTNGLNGQQIRDFYSDTVFIHAGEYDMSPHLWTPLGNQQHPFRGYLKADEGTTINGIIVNEPNMDHVGFFAYLDSATVRGLHINQSIFHGSQYVGGIAAEATNSTIKVSSVKDTGNADVTIITANYASGGLVGKAIGSTIDSCRGAAKYMGATIYNGGILGYGQEVSVTNDSVRAWPRMSALYSGGLVGSITGPDPTAKSGNRSHIANNFVHFERPMAQLNRVGGLVGYARNTVIENNYVYGFTKNGTLTGALGSVLDGGVTVNNCYYEQGSDNTAFGYSYAGNSPSGITQFNGTGNQVLMSDRVDGTNNLTLALNRWVREHEDEGYATWRSDLDGTNHGYPVFGIPDIVPVYENFSYESCDSFYVEGELVTESGIYHYHVVDSAELVDSNITVTLTINHSSLTQLEDTILRGENYHNYGFHLTAAEIALLHTSAQEGQVTIVVSDTLQSEHGCDSIVTLYLTLTSNGTVEPSAVFDLKVYPNPTVGMVNIETSELLEVELYDGISRRLDHRTVEGNNYSLDLSGYPTGIYYLRLKTSNGTVIKKIIKQ